MIDYFMTNEALLQYIGKQMQQMRINARLSQQQLAERAGISRSTVTQVENGKGMKLESIVAMLRVLNKLEILNHFETQALVSPLLIAQQEGMSIFGDMLFPHQRTLLLPDGKSVMSLD